MKVLKLSETHCHPQDQAQTVGTATEISTQGSASLSLQPQDMPHLPPHPASSGAPENAHCPTSMLPALLRLGIGTGCPHSVIPSSLLYKTLSLPLRLCFPSFKVMPPLLKSLLPLFHAEQISHCLLCAHDTFCSHLHYNISHRIVIICVCVCVCVCVCINIMLVL